MLAEVYSLMGQPEAGWTALSDARVLVEKTGERYYEAELHRIEGELLLQLSADNSAEVESCFLQSIKIVQNQHAKAWEPRAVTSLARLWQSQGKRQQAYDLLDAKALLEALSEGQP
jgi:predicted ATPase